jgi:hypothetical protein
MMTALDRHRKYAESQIYYEKKRSEGKKNNQAIRSLGAISAASFTKCSGRTRVPNSLRKGEYQEQGKFEIVA